MPNYTDWMKHRVDSDKGKLIYSHRMSVVDRLLLLHNLHFRHGPGQPLDFQSHLLPGGQPVFGNIGTNKRLNRFSLRGKKKVQGQWQLYCLIQNIEKLKNYGKLVA